LHVLGSNTTDRGQLSIQSNNASNAAKATWYYNTTNQGEIGTTGSDFYALAVNNFAFYAGGSERMRITSGGSLVVGGTTAYAKFTIAGNTTASAADNRIVIVENPPSGNLGSQIAWTNSSTTYPYASVGFNNGSGGTSGNLIFSTNGNIFTNTNTERMRLDASGNLGLGVTPSAWSTARAFDMSGGVGIASINNESYYVNNAYYSDTWRYKASSYAQYYNQNSTGQHIWYTAPSGTAGNAISFTQANLFDVLVEPLKTK